MTASLAVFALVVLYTTSTDATLSQSDERLQRLTDTFWKWRLYESPAYGTKYGMNQNDERVEEITEKAFRTNKGNATAMLEEAHTIEESTLTPANRINLKILQDLLNTYVYGYAFRNYGGFTTIDPPTKKWKRLIVWMPRQTAQNYRTIILRFTAIATQIDQKIDRLNTQIRQGITDHADSLIETTSLFDAEIDLLRSNMSASAFYEPFVDMPHNIPEATRSELEKTGAKTLREVLLPAFEKMNNFIKTEYRNSTRSDVGVWSLPNGTEYYRACLRWHLSVDTSPGDIHHLGLREVDRIEGTMKKLIAAEQPDGNITAFMQRLRSNPDNYYSSEAELVSAIKLKIKITHAKLSKILRTVRDDPVQVGVSTNGPVGFYSDPSADGSRPGKFIVNVWRLDTKPKFIFDALILHEAEPGHHLQTLAAMRDSIPYFRQLIAFWNYAYVPFNWRFYTSCSEGWALYAEALGEELDAYTAPYSLFGRYSSEVTRAVRLVVDTGLHALKWSKQRAIDYMREHTTLALGSIEAEVTRYISAPGQACSYKIGELKIWELRRRAEKALGPAFDLRDFHEVLLHLGFAPLSLMEEETDNYIRRVKATSGEQKLTSVVLLVSMACFFALA